MRQKEKNCEGDKKGKKDNTIMRKNLTKKQGKYLCVTENNKERAK